MTLTRQQIVETARSWIDTPYRHQGRKKGYAVDCIGFVVGVGADLGVTIVAPSNYTDSPSGTMLMRESRKQFVEVTEQRRVGQRLVPVSGDIMVLWGWNRQEPQHFAIAADYGSRPTMIHAFSKRGRVVEHGIDDFWDKRLVAIFNFPGTEVA